MTTGTEPEPDDGAFLARPEVRRRVRIVATWRAAPGIRVTLVERR
ncbi:hypothetical protein [Aquihabitans sp. G128]|nr:hypothetical protein [Aquihabitans sp. G128]